MPDRDVLFDVLKLCFSFLDRDQSGTSAPERARVEAFLRLFVPLLFGVPHSDMEANLAHSDETPENDEEETESEVEANANASDGEAPSNGSSVDVGVLPKNGLNKKGGAADLRKRLLTHAATAAARGGQPKVGGSPVDEERGSILGEQTWIQLNETSEGEALLDATLPGRRYNFFANSTFYCLVRIFHVSLSSAVFRS
jgi:paired amphipathic helix protein Sin3a